MLVLNESATLCDVHNKHLLNIFSHSLFSAADKRCILGCFCRSTSHIELHRIFVKFAPVQ